ncbi:MAG: hypothetical protein AAFR28_19530, partial [Pseudomonadota bacterium]
ALYFKDAKAVVPAGHARGTAASHKMLFNITLEQFQLMIHSTYAEDVAQQWANTARIHAASGDAPLDDTLARGYCTLERVAAARRFCMDQREAKKSETAKGTTKDAKDVAALKKELAATQKRLEQARRGGNDRGRRGDRDRYRDRERERGRSSSPRRDRRRDRSCSRSPGRGTGNGRT